MTPEHWNTTTHTTYSAAKVVSEQEAWQLSKQSGIPLIVMFAAGAIELVSQLTGKEPLITRKMLADFNGRYNYIDASKTYDTFNYTPIPLEESLVDALNWLVKIEALPSKTYQHQPTPTK